MSTIHTVLPLIVVLPLLGAFSSPIFDLISRKLKEAWILAISAGTLGVTGYVFYYVFKNGPLLYTMGATNPFGHANFPIRIVWEIDMFNALIALTVAFVSLMAIIYSIEYMKRDTGLEKYYPLILILELGMLGIVVTGDLFNFYVFLEIMSIASYALVAFRNDTWEGIEAGVKYMMVGALASSFILLGIALLYGQYGTLTMAYIAYKMAGHMTTTAKVALALLMAGLLFKSGSVPVHMWLADAHPAAPSSVSAMLSGLVIKAGGIYILARILFSIYGPSINVRTVGWIVIIFACLTLIIGNAMAVVQTDMKRLLAYSSVGQMGYILLGVGIGLAAYGSNVGNLALAGAIYHTVNHALMKALLFLIAGVVIHSLGTRNLNDLSGIAKTMPVTSFAFIIGAAAIIGMPPLNGFASKWILYESSALFNPVIGAIAIIGTAFCTAAYVRVIYTFFGRPNSLTMKAKDPGKSMLIPIIILTVAIIVMGLFPWTINKDFMLPAAKALVNQMGYIHTLFAGGV